MRPEEETEEPISVPVYQNNMHPAMGLTHIVPKDQWNLKFLIIVRCRVHPDSFHGFWNIGKEPAVCDCRPECER